MSVVKTMFNNVSSIQPLKNALKYSIPIDLDIDELGSSPYDIFQTSIHKPENISMNDGLNKIPHTYPKMEVKTFQSKLPRSGTWSYSLHS